MNTLLKLRNIFRDIFDDETLTISEDTSNKELEDWDSVAQVKLVLAVESEFGIRMTTDEVASIKCVRDFIRIIENRK